MWQSDEEYYDEFNRVLYRITFEGCFNGTAFSRLVSLVNIEVEGIVWSLDITLIFCCYNLAISNGNYFTVTWPISSLSPPSLCPLLPPPYLRSLLSPSLRPAPPAISNGITIYVKTEWGKGWSIKLNIILLHICVKKTS